VHRLSKMVVEPEYGLLVLKLVFEPNAEKMEEHTVRLGLSHDMNMLEVGIQLQKFGAIILGHHEKAQEKRNTR
jgi:hypothetical protein